MNWNVKRFSMLNISQVILMRTDSNLCRKELTVHWSAPNSLIRSYLQPCTNSMWEDESEAVAHIIWLYQIVDAQKEEVFFPELLTTLRSYACKKLHAITHPCPPKFMAWMSNYIPYKQCVSSLIDAIISVIYVSKRESCCIGFCWPRWQINITQDTEQEQDVLILR